jgi:hypothetical protein
MEHRVTDLERIRRDLVACRDIPWSCSCVEPEQLAALVEEVERLRGERAAVVAWLRRRALVQPNVRSALLMGASADEIERDEHRKGPRCIPAPPSVGQTYEQGIAEGVRRERAAVVAWLRAGTAECRYCLDAAVIGFAAGIERGEHRREEGA